MLKGTIRDITTTQDLSEKKILIEIKFKEILRYRIKRLWTNYRKLSQG